MGSWYTYKKGPLSKWEREMLNRDIKAYIKDTGMFHLVGTNPTDDQLQRMRRSCQRIIRITRRMERLSYADRENLQWHS